MCFRAWMVEQDWKGKQLDKDLLVQGNKMYSPDTCVFVDGVVNNFLTDRAAARGEWPIGVIWHERAKKFMSQCNNPFTKKYEYLGYFHLPESSLTLLGKQKGNWFVSSLTYRQISCRSPPELDINKEK